MSVICGLKPYWNATLGHAFFRLAHGVFSIVEDAGRVLGVGAALCAKLADMPADGWQHMVCVEAAQIDAPVPLAPGATWTGWQHLTVG